MAENIEQRLADAATAYREHEVTADRCRDLADRLAQLSRQLEVRRADEADERKDVERLEGMSLTRIVASLRGSRDDALERERAEADAARYRVAELEARLDATKGELAAARARLEELARAPSTYVEVLAEKERHLSESDDPRGRRLLELADARGRLNGELRELGEAQAAAGAAQQALHAALNKLGSASGWSTYDTFFGGGIIGSAIKHSRLDDAAAAAAYADRCLAVLRTELADVEGGPSVGGSVAVDGLTRFVDVWFDNIFTDFAVGSRIRKAQDNVRRSIEMVRGVQQRLHQRTTAGRERLSAMDTERHALLTSR